MGIAPEARDHTRELHALKLQEQRTCVVKGLGKHVPTSAVCAFMEPAGRIQEVQRVRKTAFVTFNTARQAAWAVARTHTRVTCPDPRGRRAEGRSSAGTAPVS